MPNQNPTKHQIARTYASVVSSLVDIWMDKNSSAAGHTYIGVILTEAFYTSNQWVTPQYIYSRMGVYSVDTIRRRLEEMVDQGLIQFMEVGPSRIYRALPSTAEETIKAFGLLKAA